MSPQLGLLNTLVMPPVSANYLGLSYAAPAHAVASFWWCACKQDGASKRHRRWKAHKAGSHCHSTLRHNMGSSIHRHSNPLRASSEYLMTRAHASMGGAGRASAWPRTTDASNTGRTAAGKAAARRHVRQIYAADKQCMRQLQKAVTHRHSCCSHNLRSMAAIRVRPY